jgi:dihydrofolate reductase
MGKLIYSFITSLDGYVADKNNKFEWAEPDEEVHIFINNLQRSVGTYLLGRKMYEIMSVWDIIPTFPDQAPYILDYATIWKKAEKIVFSKTLTDISSLNTRTERNFNPEMIIKMKLLLKHDILIGGPNLAAQAVKAGLIDEYHLFITPVVVGGGNQFLPDDIWLVLELLEERRFDNGMIYLYYRDKTIKNT